MVGAEAARISRAELTALAADVFCAVGIERGAAEDAAEILVITEMMGVATHGIGRVLSYGERLRRGRLNPRPQIACEVLAPGLRRIAGDNGLGPAIGARALKEALQAARETGIAAVICAGSNHFGAAAPYCWLAAEEGFASIVGSNAAPMIAPSGGREARLGNNPLGFGFPDPGGDPVVLDMAMSVVSRSRIRAAAKAGEAIPDGWATDLAGRPTSDAATAVEGLLLPIGGYKGYGLALWVDLIAGLLSGAGFLTGIAQRDTADPAPQNMGQFFVLIDAQRFLPAEEAAARLAAFRRLIHETPRVDPQVAPRLPGERAAACFRKAEVEGIALPVETLAALHAMAGRVI